jgi:hypothetical protein
MYVVTHLGANWLDSTNQPLTKGLLIELSFQ